VLSSWSLEGLRSRPDASSTSGSEQSPLTFAFGNAFRIRVYSERRRTLIGRPTVDPTQCARGRTPSLTAPPIRAQHVAPSTPPPGHSTFRAADGLGKADGSSPPHPRRSRLRLRLLGHAGMRWAPDRKGEFAIASCRYRCRTRARHRPSRVCRLPAIDTQSASPTFSAPPFSEIRRRYNSFSLVREFVSIGQTGHYGMPPTVSPMVTATTWSPSYRASPRRDLRTVILFDGNERQHPALPSIKACAWFACEA
jgi:hypothetical protein